MSHYGYIGAPEDEPGYWSNHGPEEEEERECDEEPDASRETVMTTTGKFVTVTADAPDEYRVTWSYRNLPAHHFDTREAAIEFAERRAAEDGAAVLLVEEEVAMNEMPMTEVSLVFRNGESGSSVTLKWENGQVSKAYNGKVAGARWPHPEQPVSLDAFEQWCRRRFMLPDYWCVKAVSGFKKSDIAA